MKNGHDTIELRMALPEDAPWLAQLAQKEMPSVVKDVDAAEAWVEDLIENRRAFVARSDHAFVIAHIGQLAFDPSTKPLVFHTLCADTDHPSSVWELLSLGRVVLDWGKQNGATRAEIPSRLDADLGPLAARLGFTAATPRYSKEL